MRGLDWLQQGAWRVLLCIAAGLFFLGGAEAAVTWEKGYDEIFGRSIEPTADGGYVSLGFFKDGWNYLPTVMKLDTLGNIEWYHQYRPAAGIWTPVALKPTKDGGFILCGYKIDTTGNAWVMKLDGAGNVLWTKIYHLASTNSDWRKNEGIQILEADDGGYIFLATDEMLNKKYLWLLKLSQEGDIQWQKTLSASASDWSKNLFKTKDGAYIVTAHTNLGPGIANTLVLKLDAVGTITWAKTYSGTRPNFVYSLTELNDGSFAVAGTSPISMPYPVWKSWVVKINASGNIIWQKEYSTDYQSPVMILPSADNGFLLAGTQTWQNPFMLKLDDAGAAQWSVNLGPGYIYDFQATADSGYIMAKFVNKTYGSSFNVSKFDANAESCIIRSKNYLTTTIENNFIAADASLKIVQTAAVPVSVAVVVEDLSPPTLQLYCISALPEIAVDASALDFGFGSVEVLTSASANVFVANSCGADLHVSAMTITGANAGDFTLSTDCSAVAAGGSCTAEIVFAPGSLGAKLALLTITSDDPKQPKIEIPLSGQAVDTVAPVITLLGQEELTVEAGSAYVDAGATALDNYDGNLTTAIITDNPVNSTVVGTYLVTYDVADASGNRATQLLRTVHVVDTIPPEVSLSVDRSLLWPPNHKLVDILVNGGAEDSGSGLLSLVLSVTDEYGQYNLTLPAIGGTVALEAWRDGQDQDGRVYTLTAVATDRAGNTTTRSSHILVPHDLGK